MKRALLFFTMLMVCVTLSYAQQRQVTGKVTDTEGKPIPFATIQVKGTNTGTTSDVDGNFKLNVGGTGTLIIRSVGFATQQAELGASNTVSVSLKADDTNLQEVIVTALGVQRNKNELAYSAQTVSGPDLNKTRDANIVNSLSGKVAGLEIRKTNTLGGSTNVVLRGSKSLTGNNQALFVVDGVPIDNSNTNNLDQRTNKGGYDYGNAAADINPDDVETVSVLKGAAATALYGSRASNGVIMITTKKGTRGMGVTINAGGSVGIVDKSTFPKYQKKYGAGYGTYYLVDADNPAPDDNPYFLEQDINGDGIKDLVVPTTEDASYGAPFDPKLMVYGWDSFYPGSPNYGKAKPWVAAANDPTKFFETATSSNTSIVVDGAGDKGYFKLGYTKNIDKGIMPNSQINKDLLNFGASYAIAPKLIASGSINTSLIKGQGRYGTGYDSKNLMTNMRQWWQTNVDIKDQKAAYLKERRNITWNQAAIGELNPIYWDNPYWTRYENFQNDKRTRNFGNIALNYKVTDWFDVMGRVSLDSYNELQEERSAIGSIDPSMYSRLDRTFAEYNYDLLLNFNKNISKDITFKGILGGNVRRTRIQSSYAKTNGGLLIPRLYALLNTANPMEAPEEKSTIEEVDGIFASTNFGFHDLVFLDLTLRRDQSSTLPKENNSYYYPSASLGFVFSKLTKNAPWLSHGKVRVNYAEVGNTAPPLYTADYYDVPTGIDGVALASVNENKYNRVLKPERTKSFETGLEASFLQNRVGFDLTYYKTNTVDQIVPVPVSKATGYTYKVINAGDIQNKGIEVSVFATPVKTRDFSWTLNLNWSRNRNIVKSLPDIKNLQIASMNGGVSINAALGQPYGTIRGGNFVYNDKGQKVIDAETGFYETSPDANSVIGNINPDWIGGISNTLKYKNLSLSFLVDVRQGGDVFSLDMYYGLATGLYEETAGLNELGNPLRSPVSAGGGLLFKGVNADGKVNEKRASATNYGTQGYRRNPAAAFVYDASYVKLREVALNYSLPDRMIKHMGPFKGVDFSFLGRNLWIIHKNLPNADPEDGGGSGNIQGYQSGSYPSTRNFGFNIKLRF